MIHKSSIQIRSLNWTNYSATHGKKKHFDKVFKFFDFDQNEDVLCVYKKVQGSMVVFMVLYVDDILLIGNDIGLLTLVKIWLPTSFQMKDLGKV